MNTKQKLTTTFILTVLRGKPLESKRCLADILILRRALKTD